MGWDQKIEYVEVEPALPAPVKKQVWNGKEFVAMTLHRFKGIPDLIQMHWLVTTFGPAGTYENGNYWDMSRSGNFTVMDERLYVWYQMKWGKQ
jgi:hypothetical protein